MVTIRVALVAFSFTTISPSSCATRPTASLYFPFIEAVIDFNRFLDQFVISIGDVVNYLIFNGVL